MHFLYKNTLYDKTETQITHKLRTIKEQWPGWMQGHKKLQGWEADQVNWNLTHKWAIIEQNAQKLRTNLTIK